MDIWSSVLVIIGLGLFETVSSIDNAIINAEVLATMQARARRWFLVWGMFIAVFLVRGLLPWLIVWLATPGIGPLQALTATFTNDPRVLEAIEQAAPVLLAGGGTFLVALFFHWLFLEDKRFGLPHERVVMKAGIWFYAVISVFLSFVVWYALRIDPVLAFGATVGSTAFFITHGFKAQAAKSEQALLDDRGSLSDISKILYLEAIDATFSIDGVLGAFAFTFSVPLILLGNGIGALVVRQLTIGNVERIKKYAYLKNGAMYSVAVLGAIMLAEAFGAHVPHWLSPVVTMIVIAYFFVRSVREQDRTPAVL